MRSRRAAALLLLGATVGLSAVLVDREVAADRPELLALADRLARDVSAIRRLALLRPVRRGVLDRDAILTRIQAIVAEQYTPEDIRHEGDVLRRLGMIPAGLDYEATVYGVLREQIAGFYHPQQKRLFIASWLPAAMQEPTLAHEIEHALQDQHFGIGELLRRRQGQSDRQTAVSALCEGDAVAVMIDYLLRQSGRDFTTMPDLTDQIRAQAAGGGQPMLRNAPRAVREALLFPYVEGTAFVRALKLRSPGDWSTVDAAFATPPASTEHILHPERYVAQDTPVAVTLPDARSLAAEYRAVHRDVLGELGLRLYLEEAIPESQARAAAAGWGGDQLVLYEKTAGSASPPALADIALAGRTAWDTEADATEFAAAAESALERRYPRCRRLDLPGGVGRAIDATLAAGVVRRGRLVAWAEGVPAAALAGVLDEALR